MLIILVCSWRCIFHLHNSVGIRVSPPGFRLMSFQFAFIFVTLGVSNRPRDGSLLVKESLNRNEEYLLSCLSIFKYGIMEYCCELQRYRSICYFFIVVGVYVFSGACNGKLFLNQRLL